MAETPSEPNGALRWRPAVPTTLVAISVVIAVGAVSGLLFLLYNRTRGPGEVLREFARRVDAQDCRGAYRMLARAEARAIPEETFCGAIDRLDEALDADFDLQQAVLQGQVASVHISGPEITVWKLERHRNSWRVLLPARELGPPFPEGVGAGG
ncbi:MAG: hypothetical protein ACRDI0_01490 [Actinomycetota bacterium]